MSLLVHSASLHNSHTRSTSLKVPVWTPGMVMVPVKMPGMSFRVVVTRVALTRRVVGDSPSVTSRVQSLQHHGRGDRVGALDQDRNQAPAI